MTKIDLHAHSSVSDGTESPAELVRQAQEAGLDVVAITDHDTTDGWDEALKTAADIGMTLVPGIELSTRHHGVSVHIVSYLPNPHDPDLLRELAEIQGSRSSRAERIVNNLSEDFPITWAELLASVPAGSTIGRPHIADFLIAKGVAENRGTIFDDILHPKHGYTVPYHAPLPPEGIALIRKAGGVPVLAHPAAARTRGTIPKEVLAELVDAGLFGLEIEHPENREELKPVLYDYANYFGLQVTGSSDWHGTGKENRLGDGLTKREVLEKILEEGTGYPIALTV